MISDTQRMIEFMGEHNLSPSQFMLCWILHLDKREHRGENLPTEGKAIANIYRYLELVGPWPDEEIHDLVERGFLYDQSNSKNYYPDKLKVAEKFTEAVFASIEDFERFVSAYPSFVENFNDPRKEDIPLKAVDMEKVERIFNRKVTSKVEFKRLMRALKWAKENDKIKMNILNYVSGEIWKDHLQKMEDDSASIEEKIIN